MGFEKQVYNLCIKLNEALQFSLQFFEEDNTTPIDITGRTVRLQVREEATSNTTLLDLTDGSGLTVTPATGLIEVSAETAASITEPGRYVWGLELSDPTEEPISGDLNVEQDIVRAP